MLEIEIVDKKIMDEGVQIFARVFVDGNQIGFGEDGTVDIERFRIINPPVLVADPNGDVVRTNEFIEDDGTVTEITRTFREDPEEATIQALERTIKSMKNKHDASNIVPGKRGNTTTTEYSYTGDGWLGGDNASWATQHAAATATTVNDSAATLTRLCGSYFSGSTYKIYRGMLSFDTSAIGTDTISSATITMYSAESTNSAGARTVTLVESTQASVSALVAGDYDGIGTTEFVDTRAVYNGGNATYSDEVFTLNTAGIAHINGSGDTKFAFITGLDFDNTSPSDGSTETNTLTAWADYTGTTEDPVLVVEHTAASSNEVKSIAGVSNV